MKEIIKVDKTIIDGSEVNSVNSREIYEYLNEATKYSMWIQRVIEKYDFMENIDYISVLTNPKSGKRDYITTLDMAKELCMVSNTVKGKETRKYFIAIEKQVNRPLTRLEMAKQLVETEEAREAAELKNQNLLRANTLLIGKTENLKEQIEEAENEIIERDIALDHITDISKAISIKEWAHLLYGLDSIKVGQNRLFRQLRDIKYFDAKNNPMQNFIDQKLFIVKQSTYWNRKIQEHIPYTQTLITPKGIDKLTPIIKNKFKQEQALESLLNFV